MLDFLVVALDIAMVAVLIYWLILIVKGILEDGEVNAQHASELESILDMDVGNTQESTRNLIREAIISNELPIGSTNAGYFLIRTEQEYEKTIANFEGRIRGLQRRIDAIARGWEQRKTSRIDGGNWPK